MLLECKNIVKNFGGITAVNKINLSIKEGEILGIIGPNGSGKSTLFNLMTGFLPVTSGEILYKGKNITGEPSHSIGRLGIARTFQRTRIFLKETVRDNIAIGLIPKMKHSVWDTVTRGRKNEERLLSERCAEVLHIIGLYEYSERIAGELDQEKQKRVAIGIGLATDPILFLLDEPTGGINVEEVSQLIDIIKRVANKGITICLIEHKVKMIMELCSRIVVLNFGEKIVEGSPGEIIHNENAIRAYLGKEYVTENK